MPVQVLLGVEQSQNYHCNGIRNRESRKDCWNPESGMDPVSGKFLGSRLIPGWVWWVSKPIQEKVLDLGREV